MPTNPASLTGFSETVESTPHTTVVRFSNHNTEKPVSGVVQKTDRKFSVRLSATNLTRRDFEALMRELQRIGPLRYNLRAEQPNEADAP